MEGHCGFGLVYGHATSIKNLRERDAMSREFDFLFACKPCHWCGRIPLLLMMIGPVYGLGAYR